MITREVITVAVANVFRVSVESIMQPDAKGSRKGKIPQARQMCMYLCRKYKLGSLAQVGAYYGGRDHVTCLHSEKTVLNELTFNAAKREQMAEIEKKLEYCHAKNIQDTYHLLLEDEFQSFLNRALELKSILLCTI